MRFETGSQNIALAPPLRRQCLRRQPYNPERVANATSIGKQILRQIADQTGFVVHPRRWVVERTLAWLNRNHRLAKDFEATIALATAFLYAASAMLLTRHLARSE